MLNIMKPLGYIGTALVIHLLLVSIVAALNTLPVQETTTVSSKDDKPNVPRNTRVGPLVSRGKAKRPDAAFNELKAKDVIPEEQSEAKNAKYKHRGRVRFNSQVQQTTTQPILRRAIKSTEPPKVTIVTPTPEKKNVSQIIDSMRQYKKTKLPIIATKSTTPISPSKSDDKEDDEYEEDDDYSDQSDEYRSSTKTNDFFSIPGFSEDEDFTHSSKEENVLSKDFSIPSYDRYTNYYPKSYSESHNSDSFFHDFTLDLTTPRNDFFDKKFREISGSIMKNLESIKKKSTNKTNTQEPVTEKLQVDKSSNEPPKNKSTVIIKNTKEIRLSDNEEAGTANKELSDVHGTSIYYAMSVLSTETYNIDENDGDCDNDTVPFEPTPSTSSEEETSTVKPTQTTFTPFSPKKPLPNYASTPTKSYTTTPEPLTTTERISKTFSSNYSRNRGYSKRINFSNNKENPNSVTLKTNELSSNQVLKPTSTSRRIQYNTTPKIKPIWMTPTRNVTRTYARTTYPTTIYAEHFNIKDKFTPKSNRTSTLTTVSSDIDPVLQSEIGGSKKVINSQSISDNSIPGLRKRGSTKYTSATSASSEASTPTSNEMEIPPTLTAWALAGLRSPSSILRPIVNVTVTTQKNIDENELQEVVDNILDKKAATTSSSFIKDNAIEIAPNKIFEVDKDKLTWKPIYTPAKIEESTEPITEAKSESLPAESNISVQSSIQSISAITTEKTATDSTETDNVEIWSTPNITKSTVTKEDTTTKEYNSTPINSTNQFESITKLPSGVTTPLNDLSQHLLTTVENTEKVTNEPQTTTGKLESDDFEITTIRFSYVPTESEEATLNYSENETNVEWKPLPDLKPRTTQPLEDAPITTYRPKYITTARGIEDTTIEEQSTQFEENNSKTTATEEVTTAPTEITTKAALTTTFEVATADTTQETPTTQVITLNTESKPVTTQSSSEGPVYRPEATTIEATTQEIQSTTETIKDDFTTVPAIFEPETTQPTVTSEEVTESEDKTVPTTEPVDTTRSINELEDLSSYGGEMTTESSSRVLDEAGSGAAVAIAVSTIGVIALILLVGLLLVVRRRSRHGVYAQRCTPVSLDAYSLDSVSVGHRKGNQRLRASKRSYGNPAYDDEVTSHPMQYPALANFAMDIESISAEFAEIPSVSVRLEQVPVGCEDKNRYSNVLPLPETRVQLKMIGNDPITEYINANFITGPGNIKNYYIACQAPLPTTVVDFWRMIWEQNSRLIVMLTEYMENGVEKCYEYLPPSEVSDNKRTFGEYQVVLRSREQRDKYAVSSVHLINLNTRTWREVIHLWYFWPAKGVPDDYQSVIEFILEMRSYMKISQTAKEYDEDDVEVIYGNDTRTSYSNLNKFREETGNGVNVYSPQKAEELLRRSNNGTLGRMKAAAEIEGVRPCVVVCASGAGRSGALIALDICSRALTVGGVDVPRVVRELRAQRPHSLPNRHHYIFLYKVLSEYGNKLLGGTDAI